MDHHLAVFLSLSGSTNLSNNTEILITDIGEDTDGGLPSLTCHTDLTACCRGADHSGDGGLGQWTYPGGELLPKKSKVITNDNFYFVRNAPKLIRLARINNPLSPTGSYCCTVPTTRGDMTLCANLGE